jgi:hypothetical protein
MGGMGSGSWYRWDSKTTTESQHRVDIRWFKKQGCLRAGKFGRLSWSQGDEPTGSITFRVEQDQIVLNYRRSPHGGEWEDVEEVVRFERTACNYGGYRMWFLCPNCWKRVAVLYGASKYFLCRHCYDLTYAIQQESRSGRLMEKARKIQQRLGGNGDMSNFFPDKPKGMHWKTYQKLRDESEQAENLAWLMMGQQFGFGLR